MARGGEPPATVERNEKLLGFVKSIFNIEGRKTRREDIFRGLEHYDSKLLQYLDLFATYHELPKHDRGSGVSKVIARVFKNWAEDEYRAGGESEDQLAEKIQGRLNSKHMMLLPSRLIMAMRPEHRLTFDAAVNLLDGISVDSVAKLAKVLSVMVASQSYLTTKAPLERRPKDLADVVVLDDVTSLDLPPDWKKFLVDSSDNGSKEKKRSSHETHGGAKNQSKSKKAKTKASAKGTPETKTGSDGDKSDVEVTRQVSRTLERMLRAEVKAAARFLAEKDKDAVETSSVERASF